MAGMLAGMVLGFIIANLPGMLVGLCFGYTMGRVRDRHGVSVTEVFQRLPRDRQLRVLRRLAMKVLL